ncbi:MAG: cytochrome P450, partial [Pseudomonadota bacterium]
PGETEVISRLSSPFAIRVMTRFLGLADETGADLKPHTESFFRLFAPLSDPAVMERVNADLAGFRTYLGARMAAGEVAAEGLLAQAGDLSPEALIDNAILLFADGIENIERGTATILRVLAREGALGRAPLKPLISEALRLETPAQVIARVVRQETDVAGRRLAPGTPVFLGLGAANRDPSAFVDAERFRPGRTEEALTFGRGRHSCMGSVLAAAQFEALLSALTARGTDVPDQQVRYLPRAGHLWPESLIVTLA